MKRLSELFKPQIRVVRIANPEDSVIYNVQMKYPLWPFWLKATWGATPESAMRKFAEMSAPKKKTTRETVVSFESVDEAVNWSKVTDRLDETLQEQAKVAAKSLTITDGLGNPVLSAHDGTVVISAAMAANAAAQGWANKYGAAMQGRIKL